MAKLIFVLFLISQISHATDVPKSGLEKALANDWGPACEIKGKSYGMESEDEAPCKARGGTMTVGPRKILPKLNMSDPRENIIVRPSYNKNKPPDYAPSAYDHNDPLENGN